MDSSPLSGHIDSRLLKEVEFSTSLRGYNTDEVDEFLETITAGVDRLRSYLQAAVERAEAAERTPHGGAEVRSPESATDIDETLRKTLILAQRTADMAIKEAQDEAEALVEQARGEAHTLVEGARDSAQRITSDAERRLRDEVVRLTESRDNLANEVETLVGLLGTERSRLAESLGSALRYVEESMTHSDELHAYRIGASERAVGPAVPEADYGAVGEYEEEADEAAEPEAEIDVEDEVEAAIAADAAAAAPSRQPSGDSDEYDWDSVIRGRSDSPFSSAASQRPTLTSMQSHTDALQDTAAWQLRSPRADWPA